MIIVVMGVAGAGKSSIGQLLASELRCEFLDGDSLHPPANIHKMTVGIPLTDADRARLLERQHHFMKAEMLASQFADLEEPTDAIVIDVEMPPSVAAREVLGALFPA